jgi:hypothetical protein
MVINVGETLIPIKPLFQKLTFRPEVISKPLKIAFKVHRYTTEASPRSGGYELSF